MSLTASALLLAALVLPTLGAIVVRLLARWQPRIAMLVGGLVGVVALACLVATQWMPLNQLALGRYAIFVPSRSPLLNDQTFALAQRPPSAPLVAIADRTPATIVAQAITPTAPEQQLQTPTAVMPTPLPSATPPPVPTPTTTPTTVPSNTTAATAVPTALPTATTTNVPTEVPTATQAPVPTATSRPTTPPTPVPPKPTAVPPRPTPVPPKPTVVPARRTYTVQPGDTLRSIAEQFGVTVQALLDANGLTRAEGDALRPDQKLIIPAGGAAAPPAQTRAPTARPPATRTYVVKPGDTLRSIAEQFGVSVQAILDANGLTRAQGDNLKPDQRLIIPVS